MINVMTQKRTLWVCPQQTLQQGLDGPRPTSPPAAAAAAAVDAAVASAMVARQLGKC